MESIPFGPKKWIFFFLNSCDMHMTKNSFYTKGYLLLLLSRFSHVWLCATPWTSAHQAPRPWDSPGKTTGVGCHFLLQCMKVKSESEVTQSCPTLCDPMDCSLPGSSIHSIHQARIQEWVAISFSSGSSWPRDQIQVSCTAGRSLTNISKQVCARFVCWKHKTLVKKIRPK